MKTIHRKTSRKRHKSRWEDDVRNDLKKMKLVKWAEQVQGRLKWKDVVGKAKTIRVVAPYKKKIYFFCQCTSTLIFPACVAHRTFHNAVFRASVPMRSSRIDMRAHIIPWVSSRSRSRSRSPDFLNVRR